MHWHILSEDNRALICQALREKAENDLKITAHMSTGVLTRQATRGRALAAAIESADEIKFRR